MDRLRKFDQTAMFDPVYPQWKSPRITLLSTDEPMLQSHTVSGKRELLKSGAELVVIWTGQYYTDVFELDAAAGVGCIITAITVMSATAIGVKRRSSPNISTLLARRPTNRPPVP